MNLYGNFSMAKINSEKQKGKSPIKWQNQKLQHIKQMDNNCYIPDIVQTFLM